MGRTIIRRPLLTVPTKTAYFHTRTGFLATFVLPPLVALVNNTGERTDSCIFRYEHITPDPSKLWKSSEGFNLDDAFLAGGIGGLILSYRSRAYKRSPSANVSLVVSEPFARGVPLAC
jgi:hypothetical protein